MTATTALDPSALNDIAANGLLMTHLRRPRALGASASALQRAVPAWLPARGEQPPCSALAQAAAQEPPQ